MTTEFQKTTAAVNSLENLIIYLSHHATPEEPAYVEGCRVFAFNPRPRSELQVDDDEWLFVGASGAPGNCMSDENVFKFTEAQGILLDLEPIVQKMRRKCTARKELEDIKEQLRGLLPDVEGDILQAVQVAISSGGRPNHEVLRDLLQKAQQLDSTALYGTSTAEKVGLLLERHDIAKHQFEQELMRRLGPAVRAARAEEARRRFTKEQEEAAISQAQAQQAHEESQRPVAQLLEASKQKLREQEEILEVSEWHCVQSTQIDFEKVRTNMPLLGMGLYS